MSLFDRLMTEARKGQQSRAGRFQNTPGDAYQHTDWRMKGARNKAGGGDFAGKNKRYPNPSAASPKNWARAAGALRALDMHNPPDKAKIAAKIKKRFGLKCVKAAGDTGCHKGDPGGGPEGGKKYQGGTGSKKQDKKLKKVAKGKKADHGQGYPWPFYHTGEKTYDPGWTQLSKAHAKRGEKRAEKGAAKTAKGATAKAAKKPKKGQKKLKKAEKKAAAAAHEVSKAKHKLSKRATQFARPGKTAAAKAKVAKAQAGLQKAIKKGKAKKAGKAGKKLGKAGKGEAKVRRIGKRRRRATKATSQQGF